MTAPVLVTGACGFIGGHLVERLLAQGRTVRALVHRRAPEVWADRVEIVYGDIRDERVIGAAVAGAGTVLHLAACACAWRRDPRDFWEVNVAATMRLLEAAQRQDVRGFVHVSTILAAPPHRPARVGRAAQRLTPYELTKMAAEDYVRTAAAHGLHAVIVRPTRVYGPGAATEANAVTRLIAQYLAGRFRFRLADGGVLANYVHAGDVAQGILLAAEHGASGAEYVVGGGENVPLTGLLATVDDVAGLHRRTVPLPGSLAIGVGHAAELWGRLGGRVPVTAGFVRTFLEDRRADITPARTRLGYAPRSLRDGVAETVAWIRHETN